MDSKVSSADMVSFAQAISEADTVDRVVGLTVGAASMCWESVVAAGEFNSSRANMISHITAARIREMLESGEVVPVVIEET